MNLLWQQGGSSADGAASSDEEDEDIDAEDDFHYEMEEEPTYVLSVEQCKWRMGEFSTISFVY